MRWLQAACVVYALAVCSRVCLGLADNTIGYGELEVRLKHEQAQKQQRAVQALTCSAISPGRMAWGSGSPILGSPGFPPQGLLKPR
jgi:hypothetical protein